MVIAPETTLEPEVTAAASDISDIRVDSVGDFTFHDCGIAKMPGPASREMSRALIVWVHRTISSQSASTDRIQSRIRLTRQHRHHLQRIKRNADGLPDRGQDRKSVV